MRIPPHPGRRRVLTRVARPAGAKYPADGANRPSDLPREARFRRRRASCRRCRAASARGARAPPTRRRMTPRRRSRRRGGDSRARAPVCGWRPPTRTRGVVRCFRSRPPRPGIDPSLRAAPVRRRSFRSRCPSSPSMASHRTSSSSLRLPLAYSSTRRTTGWPRPSNMRCSGRLLETSSRIRSGENGHSYARRQATRKRTSPRAPDRARSAATRRLTSAPAWRVRPAARARAHAPRGRIESRSRRPRCWEGREARTHPQCRLGLVDGTEPAMAWVGHVMKIPAVSRGSPFAATRLHGVGRPWLAWGVDETLCVATRDP